MQSKKKSNRQLYTNAAKIVGGKSKSKNQPLLYQLSSGNQNIFLSLCSSKKNKQAHLTSLMLSGVFFTKLASQHCGIAGTANLPYTIDFITTEKYNAVTVVVTQAEQIRTVTFRERLTNLQRNKMLIAWQNITAKPKAIINTDVWSSLDIKEVNKQFYISIKEKFDALIEEIKLQYPEVNRNESKMDSLNRQIYFLLVPERERNHSSRCVEFRFIGKYTNLYNKILKRLFFDTLQPSFSWAELSERSTPGITKTSWRNSIPQWRFGSSHQQKMKSIPHRFLLMVGYSVSFAC